MLLGMLGTSYCQRPNCASSTCVLCMRRFIRGDWCDPELATPAPAFLACFLWFILCPVFGYTVAHPHAWCKRWVNASQRRLRAVVTPLRTAANAGMCSWNTQARDFAICSSFSFQLLFLGVCVWGQSIQKLINKNYFSITDMLVLFKCHKGNTVCTQTVNNASKNYSDSLYRPPWASQLQLILITALFLGQVRLYLMYQSTHVFFVIKVTNKCDLIFHAVNCLLSWCCVLGGNLRVIFLYKAPSILQKRQTYGWLYFLCLSPHSLSVENFIAHYLTWAVMKWQMIYWEPKTVFPRRTFYPFVLRSCPASSNCRGTNKRSSGLEGLAGSLIRPHFRSSAPNLIQFPFICLKFNLFNWAVWQ